MASSSNSSEWVLSRHLDPEEVKWVRDLASHPGFQLYQRACQETMVQAFKLLRNSVDHETMLRAQGKCDALEYVLGLPALLTQPTPERRRG